MIKIDNVQVWGFEGALRGMRWPKESFHRADSYYDEEEAIYVIGDNDNELATTLASAGPVHGKFLRMVHVQCDITTNHIVWAEFDTYKVGTVRNSQSKMHRIHVKGFTRDQFSHEGIDEVGGRTLAHFERTLEECEWLRQQFNETKEYKYWRALLETLPMGYNLTATIDFTYEVLANMYQYRYNHKMFEWRELCKWIESLPKSRWITCRTNNRENEIAK